MRRFMALLISLALIGAGCSTTPEAKQTLQELADATTRSYQIPAIGGELVPGRNRLVFAVLDKENGFVPSLDLQMYFSDAPDGDARGPVKVDFAEEGLGDRPFYRAIVDLPKEGTWFLLFQERAGKKGAGAQAEVKASSPVPNVGKKAISMPTPTRADTMGLSDICSSEPEDDLHDLSLDTALTNGKPTVVTFSTPAFCATRICGPVVDQVVRVHDSVGDAVNFIHLEVYTDLSAGEISSKQFTESMKKWELPTEPWTFVIDNEGTIKARFEGPVTTTEISDSLKGLT
ncbi:MAG: hypothetical protein ABIS18_03195 [Actinomycetota bacterium]